ncbi:dephospho-CoA kinase [Halobacillus karajensis]|uniref:Dephospho-CoA kinase n=1 Tax=Halobacillus karajensis TaxID=195088 RepID=A0A024P7K1_9BACI|nr:dephospho-CoA kinase [Halobacillus karajensis]CDQ18268.1 Dephospho-CoA kinase [Halobacillus karajensis]CDQ24621.1 Dephospho-CoA kinase [Halobacillus karajensis]CDQ29132.1 Dephospho-CoA kinase [Halobacillus karajensis]SEI05942.1 dephospho-CoA kinase [Halobacillus karajensis]
MTLVIGLTGSIASGKSTVAHMFRDLGIPVVDADQISRDVVEPGEPAYRDIVETFSDSVLQVDGTLDRKKLGKVVFTDESKRQKLNKIVHPRVREEMVRQREKYKQQGFAAVVLDIPLLFESQLTGYVEKTIVVYVNETTQLNRLMKRDQSDQEDAIERINAQIPVKKKAEMADAVIDNNGTVEESFQQLKDILLAWNLV